MQQTPRKPAKRVIDIEDLVQYACAELARQRPPGARSPLPQLPVPRSEAALLGRWTRPPGFPAISPMFAGGFGSGGAGPMAPPDPDALIVEAAIGELAAAMSNFAAPPELANGFGFALDFAGAFAAAISALQGSMLTHGRRGNRPAPGMEVPKSQPKMAANGKPGVWQIQCEIEATASGGSVERLFEAPVSRTGRGAYPLGSFGVIDWDPDPQLVVNERAEYLAWRLGLDELCVSLHGRMASMTAISPAAAMAPWLGQKDGDKPFDLFGSGAERVYSRADQLAIAARRQNRARRPLSTWAGKPRRPARPGRLISNTG